MGSCSSLKKKISVRDLIFCALIVLVLAAAVYALQGVEAGPAVSNYSEVYDLFRGQQVRTVKVEDDTLYLELREPVGGNYKVSSTALSSSMRTLTILL